MSESDNSRTAHFTMVGGDDDGGEQADNQDQPPPPNNADEEAMYLEMRRLTEEKAQSSHDLVKDLELCLLDSTPDEAVVYLDQIIASTRPEDEQVKCALVDFLPDLASQLYNCSNDWSRRLKPLVNSHFIRIVEFALQYQNVQVAKTGHVALVRLLGHGFVHHELLETRIWPILMENIAHLEDTDNLVVDTIHLMNKLMECFNDDQTERVVVPSLTQLSTSSNVAVRRVLAQLYGDFCAVASISCAEKLVLPFLRLCSDADYVTRKTCAEVFMSVSSTVSLETRKASLAPVFEKLLVDPVRWVTLAAYQSLGPFIATFAEPSITSLGYNHLGELVLKHPDGFESKGKSRPGEGDDLEDNDNRYQGSMSVGRITTDWLTFQDRNAELLQLVPDGRSHSDPRSVRKSTMRDFAKWKRQNELAFPMGNQSNNEEEEEDGMEGEAIVVLGESEDVVEEEIEDENDEAKEETPQSNEDHDEDLVIDHVEEIVCTNWSGVTGKEPKDENFNTFQFWREPLPDIDTELHSAAMDSKFQSKDQSSSPNQKSQSALSNDAFLNNNPVEIVSLRPRRILRPPTGQHRTPEKQAEEYLFRDPGAEDTPNPLGEPQRKTKLMQGLFTSSNCSPLLPSALADRDSSLNSSISSVGSNQDHPYAQYMNVTPASKRSSVSDQEADDQDIVPKDLVSQFVSMAWHASSHEVENDLAHHCAYNLPAVVLTLGPKHWGLLKSAYKTLAEAFDWKVRQTAASSIHELAVIVGEEAATQDLVPVFHGFIKDLDEVRVAALKHLAHFLKLLRPAGRETFLPLFTEFLMMDNEWRWRFRYELAEQLLQVIGFFSPADTCHHLTPIVMMLLMDRVSDVRKIALQLVTELVSHVSIDIPLLRSLLTQLAEQFAHSNRWNRRQTFALFCSRLVSESVLSGDMFSRDVLPHLLDLSWDPVPNVRLTVARALANDIMAQSFFTDITSPHYEVLVGVLKRLQADKDKDVRYFSSQVPQNLQLRINESNFKILSSSICEEETKNL